jgi:hypothetical protein
LIDDLSGQCRRFDELDLALDGGRIGADSRYDRFAVGHAGLPRVHEHDGGRLVAGRQKGKSGTSANAADQRHGCDQPRTPSQDYPKM